MQAPALSWRQARARLAGLNNTRNPDPTRVAQARRDYAHARLRHDVAAALADPGLDDAHRSDLASLLLSGGDR